MKYKVGVRHHVPVWMAKRFSALCVSMSGNGSFLNVAGDRYYGIRGMDLKRRDWYEGMFMGNKIYEWYEPEFVVDLVTKEVWRLRYPSGEEKASYQERWAGERERQ